MSLCVDDRHPGHQQAASSVLYTTSCKHSLALLKMGEIIARNMLIEIINKIIIVASSWLFALLYFLHPFFETKKHQISNFMKIPPAKDELFHVDRQT